jgi:hypothetical protein
MKCEVGVVAYLRVISRYSLMRLRKTTIAVPLPRRSNDTLKHSTVLLVTLEVSECQTGTSYVGPCLYDMARTEGSWERIG